MDERWREVDNRPHQVKKNCLQLDQCPVKSPCRLVWLRRGTPLKRVKDLEKEGRSLSLKLLDLPRTKSHYLYPINNILIVHEKANVGNIFPFLFHMNYQ